MAEKLPQQGISRRGFLKGAAISAGAVAMAGGMIGTTQDAVPPKKWDRKTDIIVAGAGGAGLMAAVRASDGGAKVIIFQKAPTIYTSSTTVSGGLFAAAGTRAQKEKGIEDSAEKFYQDFMKNGGYMNIPEMPPVAVAPEAVAEPVTETAPAAAPTPEAPGA